jgi:hypothetical protein
MLALAGLASSGLLLLMLLLLHLLLLLLVDWNGFQHIFRLRVLHHEREG